ncbi:MAG: polysaccharide deacetylase family protein [Ignavibacteria bacterium]|nr:polysaccharide deacetylase family protein [Ignavibacteria bacterium]
MKLMYQPPQIVQKIFNGSVWHSTQEKVLLTFDDGPNPSTTEKILKTLNEENIQALFFCVGNNVKRYPELTKTLVDSGNILGNHTFNHKVITKLTKTDLRQEILTTNRIIEDSTGVTPKYFRPPYGKFPILLAYRLKQFQLKNVMWSLLPYDYKNDLKVVKFAIKNYLANNSIVVLHDSDKSSLIICDTIKYLAEEVRIKNFQFGTPEECLK